VLTIIKHTLQHEPHKWRSMVKCIRGVSEETTTGVLRL
jgi:S-adenosylhomocysteine hydrolase